MIKMVVFDMAGTTVDEDNVVYKTVRKAINEEGYDFSLEEVLTEGAGKEKLHAIKSVLALKNIHDDVLAQKMFASFVTQLDHAYKTNPVKEQPNASELFRKLRERNVLVVLNTGYNAQTAEELLSQIGWKVEEDIDALVTASDVKENRPQPDMILYAMQQLGVEDAGQVIKVGDSMVDIEEGKNAGCEITIGITTGAQTREQLLSANPSYVIDNLLEILPVIEKANLK